ncbi:MAG: DUF308 domain-containing protein [Prevotella sp.]
MKTVQSSFIRSIFAIIIGALLVKYREDTVTWLIILIGILFLISGLISTITYFIAKRHAKDTVVFNNEGQKISGYYPPYPIVGIGSMLLGFVLALMPNTFISSLMYILAIILILGVINQFVNLATISRMVRVGLIYWLLPCVVLLIAIIALFKPTWIASMPLFILGWTLILFGIIECIDAFKTMTVNKKFKHVSQQQPTPPAAEITEATEINETAEE